MLLSQKEVWQTEALLLRRGVLLFTDAHTTGALAQPLHLAAGAPEGKARDCDGAEAWVLGCLAKKVVEQAHKAASSRNGYEGDLTPL